MTRLYYIVDSFKQSSSVYGFFFSVVANTDSLDESQSLAKATFPSEDATG